MTEPAPTTSPEEDLVPVSVRLGEVVPPEDPEDWTRPLTWIAAIGMLAAPIAALGWFVIGPPAGTAAAEPATWLVGMVLAVGAAATGATQQGALRAGTATLGAGLFAALVTVIVGIVTAGERQLGQASPTLAHAFAAAVAGLAGAGTGAAVAAIIARLGSRLVRFLPAAVVGVVVAAATMRLLFPG
jgi:hypothetical protein